MSTQITTEEEFDARFTLVEFPDGDQTTTDKDVMQQYPPDRVWTLVDDGDGGLALCSGFAIVNFLGWQVTEEPHPGGNGDIVVEMPDPHVSCQGCWQPRDCVDDNKCEETQSGHHEWTGICKTCHQRVRKDRAGTWIDDTEGDVCMSNDGVDGPHQPPA